jgi:hypothetical protein
MSKEKNKTPSKSKAPKHNRSLAFRRAYLPTVCLEYIRHHSKIRPSAKTLGISPDSLYQYIKMPEWDAALDAARQKIEDETAKSIVLDRSMLDQRLLQKIDKIDVTEKAFLAELFKDLMGLGYESLGLGSQAPRIGISASASAVAGSVSPNGTDAFQVFEAQWLTERHEQWGDELTQRVRRYLSTSIPEANPAPTLDAEPPKNE